MWKLIKDLSVRGAPLIGVAAVLTLAVCKGLKGATRQEIIESAEYLKSARPTAVNLMTCCDLVSKAVREETDEDSEVAGIVCRVAQEILQKEVEMYDLMSKHGAALIQEGEGILTHCNTGSLATPGKGLQDHN